ncbi:translational activator [Lineolata rhizophorae]|uniref:eIF-2-alpha kinase activator GCN1 n=1 Tax=Lineolata rhizophorae TaxID=578093 RepID=A0A6A6P0S0_9PEZI|nr:translational activator [Lineolata rhizophorae]
MTESNTGASRSLDRDSLRQRLFTSSTKTRIAELHSLHYGIDHEEIPLDSIVLVLELLFETYPFYVDRPSRRAVQQCLEAACANPNSEKLFPKFLSGLETECAKTNIAPSNAFALCEWCSTFLQQFAPKPEFWKKWGLQVVQAYAGALERCIGTEARPSVKHSALVVARRGLRKVFKSEEIGTNAVASTVKALTTKPPNPSAKNAVFLGVIAGVCARIPSRRPTLAAQKGYYYSFYIRELLSSKTILPGHIANAFHDFFEAFTTLEDLQKEVIPSLEKAMLRAPEVVLNNLVAPMVYSLPPGMDLSEVLSKNLLKPLLSNVKSTNSGIRNGVAETFEAVASKCADEQILGKVVDEILNPLKQSKVPAAEGKVLHSQMISNLRGSITLAKKVPSGLAQVALKESNEAALAAETNALSKHTAYALANGIQIESSVAQAFHKGLADKRVPIRRLWALRAGDLLWNISADDFERSDVLDFAIGCLKAMTDSWNETKKNPVQAVQSGLVPVALILTALGLSKLSSVMNSKMSETLSKFAIAKNALIAEPKPSFLLNYRIYSKLTTEDDLVWFLRALSGAASEMSTMGKKSRTSDAVAQAYLYILSAPGLPPVVRRTVIGDLATTYVQNPEFFGAVMISAMWEWQHHIETNEKDTAAIASKAGSSGLGLALQSIWSRPSGDASVNGGVGHAILEAQLIDLLVLARPELIPRSSWIDLCLRTGIDPGGLVKTKSKECLGRVIEATDENWQYASDSVRRAAYKAAADLAFVAPDTMVPLLVDQIKDDLDPDQLETIGPTEAAIFRTPEGTAYVDVLSQKGPASSVHKSSKDYDTLKWEAELRAQLAAKKGQSRKLTADEQAKVNAQLAKEKEIRRQVAIIEQKLARGIGIIESLATGPPTDAGIWFGHAVSLLLEVIKGGAALVIGDRAAMAFLALADLISPRLGVSKPFVGVATLRGLGNSPLRPEMEVEALGDLVTRILYRLRFMAEQRPFDNLTVTYVLPFLFLVLEKGGIGKSVGDEADEQILLSMEYLTFHTDSFASRRLPRAGVLSTLISSMRKYNQHYKILKDCLIDSCRSIAPEATDDELAILVGGCIVPEVSVRTAVLQSIDAEIDLIQDYYEEVWLACHDDVEENVELARTIWEENGLHLNKDTPTTLLPHLTSKNRQLRRAAARSLAEVISTFPDLFHAVLARLEDTYRDKAKPKALEKEDFGLQRKKDVPDPWEARSGIALALKEMSSAFTEDELVPFVKFLIQDGPLGDRNSFVREEMIDAATTIIALKGAAKVEELMGLFENALRGPDKGIEALDLVNEAVVILYGALARHLKSGDSRVPKVVQRLMDTLSTPSETVQYAVAECLPPLIQTSIQETPNYVQRMMVDLLQSKKYATKRGAAYGLAGIVRGKGIVVLREYRIMSTLKAASENKKDVNERVGAFLAYELLSLILGKLFEPYVIQVVPQLLSGFGDSSADVREACLDAAKTCFSSLSSYGVKQILPTLLEGLDDQQWRSKKGACDLLGAMAYLDPQQLAMSLPDIIPPLTTVLNDSHKEVRASANRSLQRFGEVISNPEIKGVVNILLKALSDPTKYTEDALDSLIKVSFVHYLDAPSLALVVRILERGLGDRSATKRKAAQIIGSLAHLTERKDLVAHLPILVAGLKVAIVDPVPATRATASKALGSTIEKLGEDTLPDLIPSLMTTLKSDAGAGDRLGSAQALSEVLAGLGTSRLEETLPSILQNVSSSKASVREGFMSLFIFLPACFGNSFANYLSKIIPPILAGLADDVESIRETALRAGRLLVKNFATRAIDLLLPELERGLADDSHRIRLSSVELVGDLLFNLTGISAKAEQDEAEEAANEAGSSLLEVLGEERRNKVLSALYICRCDTSGLVRSAAVNVWKALVATPRTLRELVPTLTQLIIRRLASSNMEQKLIAGNALGELIRKAGEGVLATLLPTLEEGLQISTDTDAREGICIALREVISSSSPEALEDYEKTLISVVRSALVDHDENVREAAAEAFDALQKALGKKAIDQVLPYLLNLLRSESDAESALSALLTLLTDNTRSNIILPNLLPTLLTTPMTAFNARAIASLAEVAGSAMTRRLPNIINSLMDNIVACKDPELKGELDASLDTVLLSVDEYDGLNTAMSVMITLMKNDDHHRRAAVDLHMAHFVARAELDYSRYHADLVRNLLISFADSDLEVVKAAWTALSELTKRLKKEEMESLVIPTRQVLQQVGVAGSNLPGFNLPKGINAVLPIFLQGLMNGTAEQRTQAALAISDIIDRTSGDSLKPFVTQITGPLIRVVSERSVEVKAAILFTLNNILEKIPTFLKPFLPQLQRTFAKSLADTSSELLRSRAAKALGTLITLTPRIDPLIAELVTGSKTADTGVKNAMLKALYEVVSKAGANMNEASRSAILGLIDGDLGEGNDSTEITNARLLGAMVKSLPLEVSTSLIKSRVLTTSFNKPSVFALNSILLESPETLTSNFVEETSSIICQGIGHSHPVIADNCILAAGKLLLSPTGPSSYESTRPLIEALAPVIAPGQPTDTRRLALVVTRTVARHSHELVRPHLPTIVPPVFASVRDMIIPVKLSAEAAFLELFDVVEQDTVVFEKFLAGLGGDVLSAGQKRSMQDYFKRVVLRLAAQARERREAEGGAGGLGLSSDEREDEREVWSVGKVELNEVGAFD